MAYPVQVFRVPAPFGLRNQMVRIALTGWNFAFTQRAYQVRGQNPNTLLLEKAPDTAHGFLVSVDPNSNQHGALGRLLRVAGLWRRSFAAGVFQMVFPVPSVEQ